MRGALPQALLVRGKSTSTRLRLPPRAHAKAVMQAPHRPELWYRVPGHPLRSGTCICRLQSALRSDPGTTPRPAHIARRCRRMPLVAWHGSTRWCISRAASWCRPEHRVFTPWWDWPQSGPVVTWRPRPVFQFGPRLCQVDRCHPIFLHQSLPAYCCTACPCAPDLSFVFCLCCTVSFCVVFISRWAFRRMLLVCGIVGCAWHTPPPLACPFQLCSCLLSSLSGALLHLGH